MDEENEGQDLSGTESASQEIGGGNPAWNDLLTHVPQEAHNLVTPILQQWDQNFDKVQSQYAPYKSFVEQNIAPDNINYALSVMQQIEQDPMSIINALTGYAKENNLWTDPAAEDAPDDQGQVDDDGIPDITQHPQFVEMRQLVETIGQQLLSERQAQQEAQEDEEIETELTDLEEEFGEFDRDWVLGRAIQAVENGQQVDSLKPFVEQYKQFEQGIIEKSKKPAPRMMPGGGAAPKEQVDLSKLSPQERQQFIVDRTEPNPGSVTN